MSEALRARILAQRRALDAAQVADLSRRTVDRFVQSSGIAPAAWKGKRVAMYRALPHELDLRSLEAKLASYGARLCFPRITDASQGEMELAENLASPAGVDPSLAVIDSGERWPTGAFGIEEPPAHHSAVDPASIDLIFVPGVAFGEKGERLGMGAGFYDRYLPKARKALRVALAFDFQVVAKLDQQAWDQRIDWIWTERRQVLLKTFTPS